MGGESAEELLAWYEAGKLVGGIGSDALERLRDHAQNYISVIRELVHVDELSILDLGSGVGIPGLLIALASPMWRVTLLDSMARRARVAEEFSSRLGLDARVRILNARAEDLRPRFSEQFDIVVARCFGPPALIAEVAVGFLRPGGYLVVSEPPNSPDVRLARWPKAGVKKAGFAGIQFFDAEFHFAALRRDDKPLAGQRAYARMLKNPLWHISQR